MRVSLANIMKTFYSICQGQGENLVSCVDYGIISVWLFPLLSQIISTILTQEVLRYNSILQDVFYIFCLFWSVGRQLVLYQWWTAITFNQLFINTLIYRKSFYLIHDTFKKLCIYYCKVNPVHTLVLFLNFIKKTRPICLFYNDTIKPCFINL